MDVPGRPLLLGGEISMVLRDAMRRADLWLPLQMTLREMRNAWRRGEPLPFHDVGASRLEADAETVCQWLAARNELLALEFVRGWAEGRFDLPRPSDQDALPPTLVSQRHLLRLDPHDSLDPWSHVKDDPDGLSNLRLETSGFGSKTGVKTVPGDQPRQKGLVGTPHEFGSPDEEPSQEAAFRLVPTHSDNRTCR